MVLIQCARGLRPVGTMPRATKPIARSGAILHIKQDGKCLEGPTNSGDAPTLAACSDSEGRQNWQFNSDGLLSFQLGPKVTLCLGDERIASAGLYHKNRPAKVRPCTIPPNATQIWEYDTATQRVVNSRSRASLSIGNGGAANTVTGRFAALPTGLEQGTPDRHIAGCAVWLAVRDLAGCASHACP